MTEQPPEPGWWLASDGNWYPPPAPPAAPNEPPPTANAPEPEPAPTATPTSPGAPSTAGPVTPDGTPRSRNGRLVLVAGVLLVLVVLTASFVVVRLRSGGTNVAINAVPVGTDDVPAGSVSLADDAVVVRSNSGKAVTDLSPDGRTFTIDAKAEGADRLAPGKTMVLTGVTAARVDRVERQGDTVVVTTGKTAITDVIKDGKVDFSATPIDLTKATMRVYEPTPELVQQEGALGPVGTGLDQVIEGPSVTTPPGDGEHAGAFVDLPLASGLVGDVSRRGQLSSWTYDFNATIEANSVTFRLSLSRDASGIVTTIDVEAQVDGLGLAGGVDVAAASVRNFRIDTPNLAGHGRITASVAAGPEAVRFRTTAMHIPMSIEVPFPVAGIPFTVGFESDARVEIELTSRNASVSGAFDARFSGNGGFTFSNGSMNTTGAFEQNWEDPLEGLEGLSVTPTALIVTITFPKVTFGLGLGVARASAYLGATYSFAPSVSGATNITPCRAMPVSTRVTAGYSAEFLGHEVAANEATIAERHAAPFDPPTNVCRI